LIQLAKERKSILTAYQIRRFMVILNHSKFIAENLLGELKVFDSQILRWKPEIGDKAWKTNTRPGSGLLYDLGSHLIDQALALFGMPRAVLQMLEPLGLEPLQMIISS
ncbi:MAG: hypothetical protein HC831_28510, partial [Chloroflexia bacterium]|nr:hypothetical protein [Chloroflexia bacterium]